MTVLNACPFHLKEDKIRILWEITPYCNMQCKHCLFYENTKIEEQKELSTEEIFKIIDNLAKEKKLNAIWLSGGEPLLRKDIIDICKYISNYGIEPSLSTNGILLNPKNIEELYEAGVKYVHLSIDGAKAQTHDSLRGVNGSFEKLMKVLDYLKDSKIRRGASFMVTEESIDEIEDVIKLAKEKELSVMSFYLVAQLGRGAKNFNKDGNELRKKLQEKIMEMQKQEILQNSNKENRQELKIEIFRADHAENDSILQECNAERFLNITYDGKLGGCPWLMKSDKSLEVGSLLEKDFIELEEECKNKILQKKAKRREKMRYCAECSKIEQCGRGCMALQLNQNDIYNGLDPICPQIA